MTLLALRADRANAYTARSQAWLGYEHLTKKGVPKHAPSVKFH